MERKRWKEKCKICGKKHIWKIGKCPSCGAYDIPIKASEKACYQKEECDGCEAYRDHLR